MFVILILILVVFFFITNSDIVISGAGSGLLLWYNNVLPLLLPFMLISGLLEDALIKYYSNKSCKSSKPAIFATLFMGLFCGYPIGAKSNAFFLQHGLISKKYANILLPISNNISPMFFIGFILKNTLKGSISVSLGYLTIFLPYITILILEFAIMSKSKELCTSTADSYRLLPSKELPQKKSIAENSIYQITFVGLYIMLCSIISEFIWNISIIPNYIKHILICATEITRGVVQISQSIILPEKIKTALILACTSFGGISSILQTNKVIHGSGLSLFHYIAVKFLCAIGSFFLFLLIV